MSILKTVGNKHFISLPNYSGTNRTSYNLDSVISVSLIMATNSTKDMEDEEGNMFNPKYQVIHIQTGEETWDGYVVQGEDFEQEVKGYGNHINRRGVLNTEEYTELVELFGLL